MRLLRQYPFVLSFLLLLVFCSVMVIRGLQARQTKRTELREAMIILQTRGYTNEAVRIYGRLIQEIRDVPNKSLLDDFQRTLLIIDPASKQHSNPIWSYHWVVSNEMERRSESTLARALKLAAD